MLTSAVTQAGALALVAGALVAWPRSHAAIRLDRAITGVAWDAGAADDKTAFSGQPMAPGRALPGWFRSRWLNRSLTLGAVAALAQVWSWPMAVAVVAVGMTAVRGLLRTRAERAEGRAEQAAIEGLGVLVAELRAGRSGGDALAAAGRHCGHPVVGEVLTRLGRSLRLGDRLAQGHDSGPEPAAPEQSSSSPARTPGAARFPRGSRGQRQRRSGGSEWQRRLVDGLRLSQVSGCALADVVAAVESDLARRGQQRADLSAAAAGHRATVALLAGLPILGLAMGSGIGADPVYVLTGTPIGRVLLLTGVGLELAGLAWSRRITSRAIRHG